MKIIKATLTALIITVFLCQPFAGYAAVEVLGFDNIGYPTDTVNQYFIDTEYTYWIDGNAADDDPNFSELYPGGILLVRLSVYTPDVGDAIPVTEKMVKSDKVVVSSKAMAGGAALGDISIVSNKKYKVSGLPAGMYIEIPFTREHAQLNRTYVQLRLVLSVNDVSYQRSRVTLVGYSRSRTASISRNSVYGVMSPTRFDVTPIYSGEVTFDFGDKVKYTTKVIKGEKFFLALSRQPDEDIAQMYPDQYIEYYNFLGVNDEFSSTGRLDIPVSRANLTKNGGAGSLYVYRVDGKVLSALSGDYIAFDSKTNILSLYTKKLESYVLSNRPLLRQIESEGGGDILKFGYASAS